MRNDHWMRNDHRNLTSEPGGCVCGGESKHQRKQKPRSENIEKSFIKIANIINCAPLLLKYY